MHSHSTRVLCLLTSLLIQSLHNKRVLSIDLSAIMAGSGIRGQFEEKFKALIKDIEEEVSFSRMLVTV